VRTLEPPHLPLQTVFAPDMGFLDWLLGGGRKRKSKSKGGRGKEKGGYRCACLCWCKKKVDAPHTTCHRCIRGDHRRRCVVYYIPTSNEGAITDYLAGVEPTDFFITLPDLGIGISPRFHLVVIRGFMDMRG